MPASPRAVKAPARAVVALASVLALGLSSCSLLEAPREDPGPDPSVGVPKAEAALIAQVPEKIKKAGVLQVGTDASYAPMDFTATDGLGGQPGGDASTATGGDVIGADVELFNAVASKLGLKTQWTSTDFSTIIDKVEDGTFDVGAAAFTVNPDREKRTTMVSYFATGTIWVVAKGNPKKLVPDAACGTTVAVQSGTIQADIDLPFRNKYCKAGNKIKVAGYASQDDATNAVLTGKADATVTDSPVANYAVAQNGELQTVGQIYDVAPYGFVLPEGQDEFGSAIAGALDQLEADGTYDAIVKKWDIGQGIDDFEVNPKMS